MKKSDRDIMEILEAYDATGSAHSAAQLAGIDPKTVRRYVAARDARLAVAGSARRPRIIDDHLPRMKSGSTAAKARFAQTSSTNAWSSSASTAPNAPPAGPRRRRRRHGGPGLAAPTGPGSPNPACGCAMRRFGGVPTYALTDNPRTVSIDHVAGISVPARIPG